MEGKQVGTVWSRIDWGAVDWGTFPEWVAALAGALAFLVACLALWSAMRANDIAKEAIDLTKSTEPEFLVTMRPDVVTPSGVRAYRLQNVGRGPAFGFWISGEVQDAPWAKDEGLKGERQCFEIGAYHDFLAAPSAHVEITDNTHGTRVVPLPDPPGVMGADASAWAAKAPRGVVYSLVR